MKTKLFTVSALIILAVMGFVINNAKTPTISGSNAPPPPATQNTSWTDTFYIGAMQSDNAYNPANSGNYYPNLDTLGFNLFQTYLQGDSVNGRLHPIMRWQANFNYMGDNLLSDVSTYKNTVNSFIDNIYANGKRKLILERPKIEWLCSGQRSDYKCASKSHLMDPELWFYSFQSPGSGSSNDYEDIYFLGADNYVRRYLVSNDDPGIVISRLRANTEQSHEEFLGDNNCDWLIKPRIRIDSSFANNITNLNIKVCRLDILNQNSLLIKSIDIRVRNFKETLDSIYRGNYIEEFNFSNYQDTSSQIMHGAWGTSWLYQARGDYTEAEDSNYQNHADIQVYWYGNCDMWIDYIRVDNDIAHDLLSTDTSNATHRLYNQWINAEADSIGKGKIMKYHFEGTEFNNIPCMAYVNSKLLQISGAPDLMNNFYNWMFVHVPLDKANTVSSIDFLYHQYIQKVGFTQIFAECYPMNACDNVAPQDQLFSKIHSCPK